ncbi:hypothetical protein Pcinc_028200 [Petrolisthes cinctipes]|uniref:Uncharacterized protein n=1 Tax=Petrolisthes cinctipes TaxID=88211 RepID=A0AAE1F3E7_PETCI|nr:hypothetical protein Pcinc_028200 [Petrolisthes cinctipes]
MIVNHIEDYLPPRLISAQSLPRPVPHTLPCPSLVLSPTPFLPLLVPLPPSACPAPPCPVPPRPTPCNPAPPKPAPRH